MTESEIAQGYSGCASLSITEEDTASCKVPAELIGRINGFLTTVDLLIRCAEQLPQETPVGVVTHSMMFTDCRRKQQAVSEILSKGGYRKC